MHFPAKTETKKANPEHFSGVGGGGPKLAMS